MDENLLPCPFCGSEARLVEFDGGEGAYVQCLGVKMHRAIWFEGDNDAANEVREQWNQRPLAEALKAQLVWHEEQDKALSKQPPSYGPSGNQWARMQHREQIDLLRAALSNSERTDG